MVCPSCGAQVSKEAEKCDYCGCYMDHPKEDNINKEPVFKFVKIFIIVVSIFVFMGFLSFIISSFLSLSAMKSIMEITNICII